MVGDIPTILADFCTISTPDVIGFNNFFIYKKGVKRSGFLQILVGHRSPGALRFGVMVTCESEHK